jgi:hypothetical protein
MAILDYPRHFVLLAGASMVLALGLAVHLPWSPVADRLFVLLDVPLHRGPACTPALAVSTMYRPGAVPRGVRELVSGRMP